MANKRQIFEALSRALLQELVWAFEVQVDDRRSKASLVDGLVRARKITVTDALTFFPIPVLQDLCRKLDLPTGPRLKGKLVSHIMAGRPGSKTAMRAKPSSSSVARTRRIATAAAAHKAVAGSAGSRGPKVAASRAEPGKATSKKTERSASARRSVEAKSVARGRASSGSDDRRQAAARTPKGSEAACAQPAPRGRRQPPHDDHTQAAIPCTVEVTLSVAASDTGAAPEDAAGGEGNGTPAAAQHDSSTAARSPQEFALAADSVPSAAAVAGNEAAAVSRAPSAGAATTQSSTAPARRPVLVRRKANQYRVESLDDIMGKVS